MQPPECDTDMAKVSALRPLTPHGRQVFATTMLRDLTTRNTPRAPDPLHTDASHDN